MIELDLSSLEKGAVNAAAAQTQEEVSTPLVEGQVAAVETPPEVIEEEVIPANPEDVAVALENIEAIIDLPEGEEGTEVEKPTQDEGVYTALAGFLKEKSILEADVEIKDEESFVAAINKTIQDNKYSGLSESQKLYMDAIESGVDDTSARNIVTNVEQISKVDETMLSDNSELAESLIKEDLLAQGWDDARALKQIERLKKTEELTSEGLVAKDNILTRNLKLVEDTKAANIQASEDAKKLEKKQIEDLKESVYGEKKALSTINVDDKLRNQVYESMTKPVAYLENGQPINAMSKDRQDDPVNFEQRLYYAYVLTNGFRDISRLQRRADSSAARKLKDAVAGLNIGMAGQGIPVHTPDKSMPDIISV